MQVEEGDGSPGFVINLDLGVVVFDGGHHTLITSMFDQDGEPTLDPKEAWYVSIGLPGGDMSLDIELGFEDPDEQLKKSH